MIFQYYGIRTIILSRLEIEFANAPVFISELSSTTFNTSFKTYAVPISSSYFIYTMVLFCTFGFIAVTCSHYYHIASNRITSHPIISHRTALRDIARPANLIVGWRFFLHFPFLSFLLLFFSFHFSTRATVLS